MKTMKRLALLALLGAMVLPAMAQTARLPLPPISYVVKDKDFTKYETPLPKTRGPANQVEVVYFFWYGSDLSWKIDKEMRLWAASQPYPVLLSPSPAVLGDSPYQVLGARIFFTLKALDRESDLGPLFFQAVQTKQVDMTDPQALVDWFVAHGIPEKRFMATINSNGVKYLAHSVARTMQMYDVQSVPTMVIDGQYQVRATTKVSPERVAAITQFMASKLSQGGPRP